MSLATYEDANGYLDANKLQLAAQSEIAEQAVTADSIVRSKLADTFTEQAPLWDSVSITYPTPNLVRTIAGMLMASFKYAEIYSEESLVGNPYADKLEARAMALLQGIVDGTMILEDVDYGPDASGDFSQDDFWPNDTTTTGQEEYTRLVEDEYPEGAPTTKFSSGMKF